LGARQAVGSSAPRGNLDLILELTGIGRYMDTLVTMEDTQRGKPDPQVFLIGAERLEVTPSRSVVVEDAVAGIQAARAGGMKSIAVRFVAHHGADKLQEAGADRVVESLEEVAPEDFLRLIGE
jgi:beta-phosphoglucomutase